MSNSPRPQEPFAQGPRAFWLILFSRPMLGVFLVLGMLLGAAAWRGLTFVQHELAPMVEGNLQKLLNRPVKLGPLKRYSLSEIEYGRSSIPPHEMNVSGRRVSDRDEATTESVVVRFNPLTALTTRNLALDVVLRRPKAYIDRNPDNRWIGTTLTPQPESGWLKIKLNSLQAEDGTITLDPITSSKRVLQGLDGVAVFKQNNQLIDFHGTTTVDSGGRIALNGNWQQPKEKLQLTARTQALKLVPLLGFLPTNSLRLKSGQYDGQLQATYQPKQPLNLNSRGTLTRAEGQWLDPLVFAKAQKIKLEMAVTLPHNQQPILKGKADIQGGEGKITEKLVLFNGRDRLQIARNIAGSLLFLGASQRMQLDLKGALVAGGQIRTKGEVHLPLEEAKLLIQAQKIPATLLDQAYQLPIRVRSGHVGGNLTVQLKKNLRPSLQGVASLTDVDAAVEGIPQPFLNTTGYVRLQGLTANLDRVRTTYGPIPLIAQGSIDPDRGYDLVADTAPVEVNKALKTLKVSTLPFPVAGQVQAGVRVGGAIERPVLTGQVKSVGRVKVDRIPMQEATAQFNLVPGLLTIAAIAANPVDGGAVKGQATLQIPDQGDRYVLNGQFQGTQLSGDAIARLYDASPGFAIGLVEGTAIISGPTEDIQTTGDFKAPKGAYPATGRVVVRGEKALLQNVVAQIKGGPLQLDGIVTKERINLNAIIPGLALTAYSPDLQGLLSGRLAIEGPFAGFSARTARAQGNLRFSKGLSLIQDPMNAQIRWDGQQILVDRASAPNFVARGAVGASLEGPEGPQLTTLNLNVQAQNYALNRLATPSLSQNPLQGVADFNGKLTGTLSAPNLASTLAVNDLKVAELAFEPLLRGKLNFNTNQGLRLNLAGEQDRINVALDAQQLPISLDIQHDKALLAGRRTSPNTFAAVFNDIPLSILSESLKIRQDFGKVSGLASGSATLDLKTRDTVGVLAVAQPGLGRFVGDRFTGKVRYVKGVGTLNEGLLVKGNSKYQLDATLTNLAAPEFSGRLGIIEAQIEDLIAFGQSLRVPLGIVDASNNPGRAADVQTVPVELEQLPLWDQLQRLAEVDEFLAQRRAKASANGAIPDWTKLKGRIGGEVRFAGSTKKGLKGTFDLNGQNWDLESYHFDQFVAKGQWTPSGINVEPLTFTQGNSLASFTGRLGGSNQSGELTLVQLPIENLADVLDLPVNLTGQLNGSATLSGQWNNPTVQGQFDLAQGTLNRAKIEQATTQFEYRNARLGFNGEALIGSTEPIRIQGKIPYALPFSAIKPETNQVDITMAIKDQGLALANLFTDQVSWVDGKGHLNLQVTGSVDKPLMKGVLALQNATLQAQSLTEPLTQVNTNIRFDRDRLTVESLRGIYNQGELTAAGNLPIFDNTLQVANPLSVNLNNTSLNLKGLYRGQVNGNLGVTGSAFSPVISGFVALQNGQVLLSNATSLTPGATPQAQASSGSTPIEFQNLQVRLGKNVRLLQPPVLSFIASGEIDLNGSLDAPRPTGQVNFDKGEVNLFTTRFRVDERRKNFAQFTPTYGLDPYLNISLRTTVTDVVSGRTTTLNEFQDVQPGSLGAIESVRVRANIQGRASQLSTRFNDVLELTSTPSRSQNEILALLSGGVTQSLQSGNAQGALVNLASSAFLNRVQSVVDDVLGSRVNFRLFPLLTPLKNNRSAALELGAELGFDVTDRLSVSALQVLTNTDNSPQFNINYDINDQFRMRGSVNLQGDAVGILEYRIRF